MPDEMEIINPETKTSRLVIDKQNKIIDTHECIFEGDHSQGLDAEDTCVLCGKKLGDLIAEGFDPLKAKIPVIIIPQEGK